MGIGHANVRPITHASQGAWVDFQIELHHGDESVSTTSPAVTTTPQAYFYELIEKAQVSQAAFETVVDDIGGGFETWYYNQTSAHRVAIISNVAVLGPPA